MQIMTREHPDWERFCTLLRGPEGCDFRDAWHLKPPLETKTPLMWLCSNTLAWTYALLRRYFPDVDIGASLNYFQKHGVNCDCQVLFSFDADAVDAVAANANPCAQLTP